eukprot:jgi/Tetstr1/439333/TSEL_027771.t1
MGSHGALQTNIDGSHRREAKLMELREFLSDHIIEYDVVDKVSNQQAAARLDAITKFRAKAAELVVTPKGEEVHKDDIIFLNTELCKTCIVEGDFKVPATKQFVAEAMSAIRATKATFFITDALFGAGSHTLGSKHDAWGTDDFNDVFAFARQDTPHNPGAYMTVLMFIYLISDFPRRQVNILAGYYDVYAALDGCRFFIHLSDQQLGSAITAV